MLRQGKAGKGLMLMIPLKYMQKGYINQFGVHRNTAYQALKDACNDLFARQFSYQKINERGNIENYRSRWVSEIGYVDNEAVVKLIFAPAIVPLITHLEEHFTKYELQQVSNLSSAYAVRLYELLIAWRSTGSTPIIELSDFRQRIGVLDTEYKRMERFKTSVLELAIKQINEHTDITVKYEQHKRGRSISGFSFTFKQKKKDNPSIERDPNTLDLFTKMTDAQRHMFANKLSELPEMGRYSQGTESYPQFAVRIAEMLQDPDQIKELYPYLKKVGYMPSNKKDTVNG